MSNCAVIATSSENTSNFSNVTSSTINTATSVAGANVIASSFVSDENQSVVGLKEPKGGGTLESNGGGGDLSIELESAPLRRSKRGKSKVGSQASSNQCNNVGQSDDRVSSCIIGNVEYNTGDFVYYEEPDFEYFTIGVIEEIKFSRRDKFAVSVKCFYRTHDIPESSKQSLFDREQVEIMRADVKNHNEILSRELFASEVQDTLLSKQLRGRCKISHLLDLSSALTTFDPSEPDSFFYVFAYNPETRRLMNTRAEIRVGHAYQATIPSFRHSPPAVYRSRRMHRRFPCCSRSNRSTRHAQQSHQFNSSYKSTAEAMCVPALPHLSTSMFIDNRMKSEDCTNLLSSSSVTDTGHMFDTDANRLPSSPSCKLSSDQQRYETDGSRSPPKLEASECDPSLVTTHRHHRRCHRLSHKHSSKDPLDYKRPPPNRHRGIARHKRHRRRRRRRRFEWPSWNPDKLLGTLPKFRTTTTMLVGVDDTGTDSTGSKGLLLSANMLQDMMDEPLKNYLDAVRSMVAFFGFGGAADEDDDVASAENGLVLANLAATTQHAYDTLHRANYSLRRALQDISCNPIASKDTPRHWTVDQVRLFAHALRLHGKDFHAIQREFFGGRSSSALNLMNASAAISVGAGSTIGPTGRTRRGGRRRAGGLSVTKPGLLKDEEESSFKLQQQQDGPEDSGCTTTTATSSGELIPDNGESENKTTNPSTDFTENASQNGRNKDRNEKPIKTVKELVAFYYYWKRKGITSSMLNASQTGIGSGYGGLGSAASVNFASAVAAAAANTANSNNTNPESGSQIATANGGGSSTGLVQQTAFNASTGKKRKPTSRGAPSNTRSTAAAPNTPTSERSESVGASLPESESEELMELDDTITGGLVSGPSVLSDKDADSQSVNMSVPAVGVNTSTDSDGPLSGRLRRRLCRNCEQDLMTPTEAQHSLGVGQLRFLCHGCRIHLQKYGELKPVNALHHVPGDETPQDAKSTAPPELDTNATDAKETVCINSSPSDAVSKVKCNTSPCPDSKNFSPAHSINDNSTITTVDECTSDEEEAYFSSSSSRSPSSSRYSCWSSGSGISIQSDTCSDSGLLSPTASPPPPLRQQQPYRRRQRLHRHPSKRQRLHSEIRSNELVHGSCNVQQQKSDTLFERDNSTKDMNIPSSLDSKSPSTLPDLLLSIDSNTMLPSPRNRNLSGSGTVCQSPSPQSKLPGDMNKSTTLGTLSHNAASFVVHSLSRSLDPDCTNDNSAASGDDIDESEKRLVNALLAHPQMDPVVCSVQIHSSYWSRLVRTWDRSVHVTLSETGETVLDSGSCARTDLIYAGRGVSSANLSTADIIRTLYARYADTAIGPGAAVLRSVVDPGTERHHPSSSERANTQHQHHRRSNSPNRRRPPTNEQDYYHNEHKLQLTFTTSSSSSTSEANNAALDLCARRPSQMSVYNKSGLSESLPTIRTPPPPPSSSVSSTWFPGWPVTSVTGLCNLSGSADIDPSQTHQHIQAAYEQALLLAAATNGGAGMHSISNASHQRDQYYPHNHRHPTPHSSSISLGSSSGNLSIQQSRSATGISKTTPAGNLNPQRVGAAAGTFYPPALVTCANSSSSSSTSNNANPMSSSGRSAAFNCGAGTASSSAPLINQALFSAGMPPGLLNLMGISTTSSYPTGQNLPSGDRSSPNSSSGTRELEAFRRLMADRSNQMRLSGISSSMMDSLQQQQQELLTAAAAAEMMFGRSPEGTIPSILAMMNPAQANSWFPFSASCPTGAAMTSAVNSISTRPTASVQSPHFRLPHSQHLSAAPSHSPAFNPKQSDMYNQHFLSGLFPPPVAHNQSSTSPRPVLPNIGASGSVSCVSHPTNRSSSSNCSSSMALHPLQPSSSSVGLPNIPMPSLVGSGAINRPSMINPDGASPQTGHEHVLNAARLAMLAANSQNDPNRAMLLANLAAMFAEISNPERTAAGPPSSSGFHPLYPPSLPASMGYEPMTSAWAGYASASSKSPSLPSAAAASVRHPQPHFNFIDSSHGLRSHSNGSAGSCSGGPAIGSSHPSSLYNPDRRRHSGSSSSFTVGQSANPSSHLLPPPPLPPSHPSRLGPPPLSLAPNTRPIAVGANFASSVASGANRFLQSSQGSTTPVTGGLSNGSNSIPASAQQFCQQYAQALGLNRLSTDDASINALTLAAVAAVASGGAAPHELAAMMMNANTDPTSVMERQQRMLQNRHLTAQQQQQQQQLRYNHILQAQQQHQASAAAAAAVFGLAAAAGLPTPAAPPPSSSMNMGSRLPPHPPPPNR